jgi:hypothetical protein
MSKIEELASAAGYNGISKEAFESGYIAGATAVLEGIEKLTCLSGEALKMYLPRKIKELKGE